MEWETLAGFFAFGGVLTSLAANFESLTGVEGDAFGVLKSLAPFFG